jgi:hypothetical protein
MEVLTNCNSLKIAKHLREKISPALLLRVGDQIDTKATWGIVDYASIQSILRSYSGRQETIYVFLITDTCEVYHIPKNVRLYRTSLIASKKQANEFVLPYIWEGISPAFPPLLRTEKPIIGFCGLVSPHRRQTLNDFASDSRFTTNYILRNQFWGGNPHNETIVSDFEENMKASHFNIGNRGAGNFSMRFYQTLSAGRIPILLNTDMELPLMDKIDWNNYIIVANTPKELLEKTWIFWNTRNISDAQTKCKEIYDTYFSGTRYLDYVLRTATP